MTNSMMTNTTTTTSANPVHETAAVLDNGVFGTRTVRFETGRLARQAAGAVVAYLDEDTMLLSATTASKQPKDQFEFPAPSSAARAAPPLTHFSPAG